MKILPLIKKTLLSFLLIMAFTTINAQNSSMNPLDNKPLVMLALNISGCMYDVRVNDVSLFSDQDGSAVETALPINEWLSSGKNTFSLHVWQLDPDSIKQIKATQPKCEASATIQIRSLEGVQAYPLTALHYHSPIAQVLPIKSDIRGQQSEQSLTFDKGFVPQEDGLYEIGPVILEKEPPVQIGDLLSKVTTGAKLSRSFTIPLVFSKWQWEDGDKLSNDAVTKAELLVEYGKIRTAIINHDYAKLRSMTPIQVKEMGEAYYSKPDSEELINDIKFDFKEHPKASLMEFVPKSIFLKIEGHGHLAKLVRWDDGAIIALNFMDSDSSDSYGFEFAKIDGKWKIVR